jgi:hypothetical protein
LLQRLVDIVSLVKSAPIDVDLWNAQNLYYEALQSVVKGQPEGGSPVKLGDKGWAQKFRSLGSALMVRV